MAFNGPRIVFPPGTKLRIGISRQAGDPAEAWQPGSDDPADYAWHDVVLGGNAFRWDANHWSIVYGERGIRLPPAKGLTYIRYLLERRNHRVLVSELVDAAHAGQREPLRPTDAEAAEVEKADDDAAADSPSIRSVASLGDAGKASDYQALTDYRDRLNDLDAEISEADDNHDSGRLETLKQEKKQILDRIAADFDRYGRPRTDRSTLNRQRKAVRKCIKSAIDQIRKEHPDLAEHLDGAIRCGYSCSYRTREDWGWQFDS